MPPKYQKTDDQDFQTFKEACLYWVEFFGLKSWELVINHDDRHIENRATCEAVLGARHATITLTKSKWSYKADQRELRLLAFHEVVELMLTPISDWAESRRPHGDLNDIRHELIHLLENSVFSKLDTQ